MRARVVSRRVIVTALAVLCGLSVSGSLADDATVGELGPIRRWVAQTGGVAGNADVKVGPVTLRPLLGGRNHAEQGAIIGAVVLGVMGGWYGAAMGGWKCEADSDKSCDEVLLYAVAGAAGGALVGGAVGGLIGSQFETNPAIPVPASGTGTRVRLMPRRGGIGIAVSHSF